MLRKCEIPMARATSLRESRTLSQKRSTKNTFRFSKAERNVPC